MPPGRGEKVEFRPTRLDSACAWRIAHSLTILEFAMDRRRPTGCLTLRDYSLGIQPESVRTSG